MPRTNDNEVREISPNTRYVTTIGALCALLALAGGTSWKAANYANALDRRLSAIESKLDATLAEVRTTKTDLVDARKDFSTQLAYYWSYDNQANWSDRLQWRNPALKVPPVDEVKKRP